MRQIVVKINEKGQVFVENSTSFEGENNATKLVFDIPESWRNLILILKASYTNSLGVVKNIEYEQLDMGVDISFKIPSILTFSKKVSFQLMVKNEDNSFVQNSGQFTLIFKPSILPDTLELPENADILAYLRQNIDRLDATLDNTIQNIFDQNLAINAKVDDYILNNNSVISGINQILYDIAEEIRSIVGVEGSETVATFGILINTATEKTTPVDADMFSIRDSVTGFLQRLSYSNLRATLKTYFDTLYNNYVHPVNHPASVITQDSNNRFVSDTDKSNWNGKSNFSGSYNDLTGKPSFKTVNGQSIVGNGDITISGGGGTSTPETVVSMGTLINASTEKTTLVDADMFSIRESVSGFLQKLSFSNLKSVLKTYFDTLYNNYTHPANHPASVITQDSNNRLVSDTEKATWNSKSNFSGAYADLSGKPTIPTALSQLTEDITHKHITEAEKANIPKNSSVVQDFSQSSITIDFAAYDIQEDDGFDANEAITTGNKDITISNPFLNKVVTVLLPKITEGTVIIFPDECKKLTGDMSDLLQNVVMIHCTKTSPARYLYTISQIQAQYE